MALTTDELTICIKHLDEFIEKRRPREEIRDQVDLTYKIEGQSVEIFEIRKMFQKNEKVNIPIAKTTFNRKLNKWRIFWQRSDLKWHSYEPKSEVNQIKEFVKVVDEDKFGCFWG